MQSWERDLKNSLLRGDAEPPEGAPSAAVALVLRKWQTQLEILLIERIEREGDPWSGQVALPGGMMGSGDGLLSRTSRRETLEEVSIDLDETCRVLGRLEAVRPANVPHLTVFPFVYSLQGDVTVREGGEVKRAFWAPLSHLRESATSRRVKVRGRELVVPAFLHEDCVIWGLTFRILTAFFETALDSMASRR